MQTNSGLQRWLELPFLYNLFQEAIGGNALRRKFIESHVRPRSGDKIIDIGCGPAQILPWLHDVEYLGFDVNPACIVSAKRTHADAGTFVVGDTASVFNDSRFRDADIVIALGILHHLDDVEVEHCIQFAYRALKQGGRFVSLEGCSIPNQGFLSRYIMSKDRGQHVRTEETYRQFAEACFKNVNTWVHAKPMRIPYAIVILECQK